MILLGSFEIKPLEPDYFFCNETPDMLCFSTLRNIKGPSAPASIPPPKRENSNKDFLSDLVYTCENFLSNKGRAYLTNSWLMSIGTVIQISIGYA